MERIICNKKFKKIIIILLIGMLLLNTILPYKVFAANCTARELRTELNKYYEITGKTVSVEDCQKIIDKITNNGQNTNSITIENGVIKIKASKETIKEAFETSSGGPYVPAVVENIISNGWDWMGVEIIKTESNPPEETKENDDESKNDSNSVAQDLQKVINENASTLGIYNITLERCKKIIDRIESADPRNKVTSNNTNGKITINISATSKGTVQAAFQHEGGLELSAAQFITENFYSYFSMTLVDPNDIPEGEEDTRTEEKKIIDFIVSKFPSITPESAALIVENGKCTVKKDENGVIVDVILNLTPEEMDAYGISDEAKEEIHDKQKEDKDTADLGGILLSPFVYLFNFIADAVINAVGSVMMPEESFKLGFGVLSTNKPNHGYTSSYPIEVDTSSFLPDLGNVIGAAVGNSTISYQYPNLPYTPEAIFSGKVELLSIDFITGKTADGQEIKDEGWKNIRKVISQWYQVLRMIAIIGLLSVLIYTGIKIIISANAKDKAKYKEWIIDWLMAVAILFAMHIIMAFIVSVTGEFSKLITQVFQGIEVIPSVGGNGSFVTNLMGFVRFMVQSENFYIKVGYEVMYITLIVYTIKFTFTYLKRVLNMAFLTLIAPIVALTYPIDKINDGKAQGFDMWLKEYIFNALLQPMHAVLYYVLVGSAVGIAAENPIYGIVVLAFMAEAEKLLKKIFGFDKASGGTVGGMASAFAAGAIASNIAKMAKLGKGNAGKGRVEGENNLLNNLKPMKTDDDQLFDFENGGYLPGGNTSGNSSGNSGGNTSASAGGNTSASTGGNTSASTGGNTSVSIGRNSSASSNGSSNGSTSGSSDKSTGKLARFKKGSGNVVKRLAKPVWDVDKGAAYNGKRLLKKAGRAYIGAGLGIAAAAVQAGISITDGKYSPVEGMAALAAGYAGGGKIASGIGSLYDTYKEGTLSDNPTTRNEELIKRAQDEWAEREDVIKYNKKYKPEDRETIVGLQKKFLEQGITDPKEMDSCIKYLKKSNNGSLDGIDDKMIQKSRAVTDFYNKDLKNVGMQKAVRDLGERQKYIDAATSNITNADEKANAVRRLENKFNETAKFLDAQK